MNNTERIETMEQRLNNALEAVQELQSALNRYEAVQEDIRVLNDYLGSDDWKDDIAADKSGLLPAGLKRGVLSEDGIWNLLEDWRELEERIRVSPKDESEGL